MRNHLTVLTIFAVALAGCGGDTADDDGAAAEQAATPTEDATSPAATYPDSDPVETDLPGEPQDPAAALGSSPQAHSSLFRSGPEPVLQTATGEVTVTFGPPTSSSFPFLVYNGLDEPISRIEVSGRAVDASGETLSSGESQSIEPNVVMPGELAMGYVFTGTDKLPDGATMDRVSVDYTVGLGDFENIVSVDVSEVDVNESRATGTVSNPHDIPVDGPISVAIACLDAEGNLATVYSSFTDRDNLEAGGESTFTLNLFESTPCDGVLVGASGFTDDY